MRQHGLDRRLRRPDRPGGYSASKGGIVGLTLPAARGLASRGVRVVTIAPQASSTPPCSLGLRAEQREALGTGIPFPSRLGSFAGTADLVDDVANPDAQRRDDRLDWGAADAAALTAY